MLNNMMVGQFFAADSIIHKLDPRIKLLLTFVYTLLMFFIESMFIFTFNILAIIMVYKLARVPLKILIKSIKRMLPILLISAGINIFLIQGETVFKFLGINITKQGLCMVSTMIVRIICLISGMLLLLYTTSPAELVAAIEKILKPLKIFKVSPEEIAIMFSIALHFVPVLLLEAERIMNAQRARGAKFDSKHLKEKLKAYITIVIPLLISTSNRANDLAIAMESRCYHGGENRTRFKILHYSAYDLYALLISLLYVLLLLIFNKLDFFKIVM
ncbi:MAG: energy-coupling factor transporter transmembrane protein EcfT [Oscillospiraceae bacterium]|nr:energy-coupling factor transporter transmembrane protein EcfT [Oscillospiraceae bacterium]